MIKWDLPTVTTIARVLCYVRILADWCKLLTADIGIFPLHINLRFFIPFLALIWLSPMARI